MGRANCASVKRLVAGEVAGMGWANCASVKRLVAGEVAGVGRANCASVKRLVAGEVAGVGRANRASVKRLVAGEVAGVGRANCASGWLARWLWKGCGVFTVNGGTMNQASWSSSPCMNIITLCRHTLPGAVWVPYVCTITSCRKIVDGSLNDKVLCFVFPAIMELDSCGVLLCVPRR